MEIWEGYKANTAFSSENSASVQPWQDPCRPIWPSYPQACIQLPSTLRAPPSLSAPPFSSSAPLSAFSSSSLFCFTFSFSAPYSAFSSSSFFCSSFFFFCSSFCFFLLLLFLLLLFFLLLFLLFLLLLLPALIKNLCDPEYDPACWSFRPTISEAEFEFYFMCSKYIQSLAFAGYSLQSQVGYLCVRWQVPGGQSFCGQAGQNAELFLFFLAVQDSSLGDLVTHWLTRSDGHWGYFYFCHTKNDPRNLWPDHDLTMTWPWPDHDLTMTWPWPDHDLSPDHGLTMITNTILVNCDIWYANYNSDNW